MSIRASQKFFQIVGLCLLVSLFSPAEPWAAPFYQGKTITVDVGSAPGGGYDRMARLFAKYLPRHIPGKPSFVVMNIPGASSMIAANQLYNVEKPDGLTIGTFNQGLPFAQLLKSEGARFDLAKFAWIGSTAVEPAILAIRSDLPYRTFDDLRKAKAPIHLASSGPGVVGHQVPMLLKEFAGLNAILVVYPGTAEQMLAIQRKEADGLASTAGAIMSYIESGQLRPLLRGRVSVPAIEHLPVDEDYASDKGKLLMSILSSTNLLGRPYVAPPSTPPRIMKILREAFANAAKDPDLQGDAIKFKMAVKYVPGDECLRTVNYIFNQPPEIIKEFSKYIQFR